MNVRDLQSEKAAPADARFGSVDCVFFVIGAQKAGTTWLNHFFRSHEQVSVPFWKENNYWNIVAGRSGPGRMLTREKERLEAETGVDKVLKRLNLKSEDKKQRAISLALRASENARPPHSEYADLLLENVTDATIAMGECCPQYALLHTDTFSEMAQLSDNVRFIFIMRDPISRFISHMQHSLRKKQGDQDISATLLSDNIQEMLNETGPFAKLTRSRYDLTINELEQAVSKDRIQYVFFEELFSQEKVREICDFIDVPFMEAPIQRKRNSAGDKKLNVSDGDMENIARKLKPVYEFALDRFGADLPQKWSKGAALAGASAPGPAS